MPDDRPSAIDRSVGLVVNPIAGLGGSVGLKGTDGADIVARALALGADPHASRRATEALIALRGAWPSGRALPRLLTGAGVLGEAAAGEAGWRATVVGGGVDEPSTADDTRRVALALSAAGADLLLFAGGDGTARDVMAAVGLLTTVLGIPAGVKVQSAVFATSPRVAGVIAASWLASAECRTSEREVLDLDEGAYRRGAVAPRLHGTLRVPEDRLVQPRKAPSSLREDAALRVIAAEIVAAMVAGRRYILGPGTTIRSVADALGLEKTLVGVDVVELRPNGPALVVRDAGMRQIERAVSSCPCSIVVTPIGGQGFVFGRGNQPISAAAIRRAGPEGLIVAATPAKLAALGGRPLLVDTGDPGLDRELAGYVTVVTGQRERIVMPIQPA